MKIKVFIFLIMFLVGCSSYKYVNYGNKPDLIIESADITVRYEDGRDRVGMPVKSMYKWLNITMKIKNIGPGLFESPLYVAYTSSEENYRLNYFNEFILVEPSPTIILPDESIEFKFKIRIERSSSNIRFQVNFHSSMENIAKESDYFNNTYSVNY